MAELDISSCLHQYLEMQTDRLRQCGILFPMLPLFKFILTLVYPWLWLHLKSSQRLIDRPQPPREVAVQWLKCTGKSAATKERIGKTA
jgi:hypothetical protein